VIASISPILSSPSIGLDAQTASPGSGVDIASGPLPQAASGDVSQFGNAIQARMIESAVVPHSMGGARWSALGKSIGDAVRGVSAQEKRLREYLGHRVSESNDRSGDELGVTKVSFAAVGPAPSGGADPLFGPHGEFAHLVEQEKEQLHLSLDMADLKVQVEVMAKMTDGVGTAVRHLSTGGGG